jgi:hypothetical protein
MQIDFNDKRVIAGLATAGVVAAVIIVLQILILSGRPSPVAYVPTDQSYQQGRVPNATTSHTIRPMPDADGRYTAGENPMCPEGVMDKQGNCARCEEVLPNTFYATVERHCVPK